MPKSSSKKTHGGARDDAGRPAFLKDAVRRNITFEARHLKKLERYAKRCGLNGHAAAIRHLIDTYA